MRRTCGIPGKLVPFLSGDLVFCEFNIADQTQNSLPHLACGKVVCVEGRRIAVGFKAGCVLPVSAESDEALHLA
jgi:hypothetical protein